MFKKLILLAIIPTISSCTDTRALTLRMCEVATKALLKSPSTYKYADAIVASEVVFLKFDSANSYGTPVRGSASCKFKNLKSEKDIQLISFSLNGDTDKIMFMVAQNAIILRSTQR